MCGKEINFGNVSPPTYRRPVRFPNVFQMSRFSQRLLTHSYTCSKCMWDEFPTHRLLGFILIFHLGTEYEEYNPSVRLFMNPDALFKHIAANLIDIDVAKIALMHIHIVRMAYERMWFESFGVPGYGGNKEYIFRHDTVPFNRFCTEVRVRGNTVYTINVKEGIGVSFSEENIRHGLKYFYTLNFDAAVKFLLAEIRDSSICKQRTLDHHGDNSIFFDHDNTYFSFRKEKKGGRKRKME